MSDSEVEYPFFFYKEDGTVETTEGPEDGGDMIYYDFFHGQIYVIITWIWTCPSTLVGIWYVWQFWKLRNSFMIKGREPRMVIIWMASLVVTWLFVAISTITIRHKTNRSCAASILITEQSILCAGDIFVMRVWIIYFKIMLNSPSVKPKGTSAETRHATRITYVLTPQYTNGWFVRNKNLIG
eukprot:501933_1